MRSDQGELRSAVEHATLHESVRDFARRVGVAHETLYGFLRGKPLSDRLARRVQAALAAAPPVAPAAPTELHAPSYWEGWLDNAAATLDAVTALVQSTSGGLRALRASGVLRGAADGSGWQLMPPPDPETLARVQAELEPRQRAARAAEIAPPAQQRRRAGGSRR